MQVDFLENQPDYGMVHGNYNNLIGRNNKRIKSAHNYHKIKITIDNFFEELLVYNFIGTLTVCARKSLLSIYGKKYSE